MDTGNADCCSFHVTIYSSCSHSTSRSFFCDLHAFNFILSFSPLFISFFFCSRSGIMKVFLVLLLLLFCFVTTFSIFTHSHSNNNRKEERETEKKVSKLFTHTHKHQFIRETIKLKTVYAFCTALSLLCFFLLSSFSGCVFLLCIQCSRKIKIIFHFFFFAFICTHCELTSSNFAFTFSK